GGPWGGRVEQTRQEVSHAPEHRPARRDVPVTLGRVILAAKDSARGSEGGPARAHRCGRRVGRAPSRAAVGCVALARCAGTGANGAVPRCGLARWCGGTRRAGCGAPECLDDPSWVLGDPATARNEGMAATRSPWVVSGTPTTSCRRASWRRCTRR